MARLLALCSLPHTNPKQRLQYVRRNGPYALYMTASSGNRLPFGTLPHLLLAWVCTEAVRTQRRELVLGRSLYEFMHKLGLDDQGGGERWESGATQACRSSTTRPGTRCRCSRSSPTGEEKTQENRRPWCPFPL